MNRVERDEPSICARLPLNNPSVVDERALGNRGLAREEALRGPAAARKLQHGRIVRVDYCPVAGFLVLENAALGFCVRLEVRMSIEVVCRKVQHHGNPGMKPIDLLELKA